MKQSKLVRGLAALLMLAALLFSVTACSTPEAPEEDLNVRQMAEQMLDALIAGDADTARALMKDSCNDQEFAQFYNTFRANFGSLKSYTLTLLHANVIEKDGVRRYTAVYRMETNEKKAYDITVSTSSHMEGLYGFHLTNASQNVAVYTGTLTTLEGSSPLQIILLVVGLATYAFVIWALVDCCRHRIRQKWLYVILIVLGSVAVLWTIQPNSFKINFNFLNLLSYTALMIYQNPADTFQLRLFVPVGAIVYTCLRRKLLRAAAQEAALASAPLYDSTSGQIPFVQPESPTPEATPEDDPARSSDNGENHGA